MMFRKLLQIVIVVMALPMVLSCAATKGGAPDILSPPPAQKAAASPTSRAVELAWIHMQAGAYQKAIDVYHAAYQKTPQDAALVKAYFESLAYISTTADAAFDHHEFGAAGKTYDVLLKSYPHFQGFEQHLTFTRAGLQRKLHDCKKALYKQGFQEYRKGRLKRAIALWQDLLVIDPQNTGIQEALRTAKMQEKNLRKSE